MAGNVFRVIMPSQRVLVAAAEHTPEERALLGAWIAQGAHR